MATSLVARRRRAPRHVPRHHRHAHKRWVPTHVGSGTSASSYGLQVFHYPAAQFPSGTSNELNLSLSRSFLASLLDAGHGSVELHNSDPDLAAITVGDYLAFDVYGVRAFVMRCESFDRVAVDRNEDAAYKTTWSGLGHLGIFKKGVVGPPGGTGRSPIADDVVYDYTHPDYIEDGSWVFANVLQTVANAKLGSPYWPFPWASAMPGGEVIGPTAGTLTTAPEGTWFGRDTFTTTFSGAHLVYFTADNSGVFSIDGKEVATAGGSGDIQTSGFDNVSPVLISLSASTHTVAFECTNLPRFSAYDNPTGVAAEIYIPGFPPTLVWSTSGGARINDYPGETPGMTPGTVIRLVLEEQQAAGRFTQISLGFTDTLDTDGVSWPVFPTIATKIGTDCLTFLKEIMATYVDVEMDPNGWTLNAWVFGTKGTSSGVTLHTPTDPLDPMSGNLVSLQQKGEDKSADELLIRWQGGWSSSGSGTSQAFLELGPQTTADEIGRIAAKVIAIYGDPREEIAAQFEPIDSTEVPWVNTNFVLGSTITVPNSTDSPVSERVYELGVSQDQREERVLVTMTAKDVILDEQERFVNALKA